MSHRMPQCARHTHELLEELERDREFDVLRKYLAEYRLFPRKRDPATAPIRYEELKELVKHWKLHSQRNFWRNHAKKEDLVRALHKHINTKIVPQEQRQRKSDDDAVYHQPTSPTHPPTGNAAGGARTRQVKEKGYKGVQLNYKGDLFGTRGNYDDGLIYLSRLGRPEEVLAKHQERAEALERKNRKELEKEEEEAVEEDKVQASDETSVGRPNREKELKRKCACSLYHVRSRITSRSTRQRDH